MLGEFSIVDCKREGLPGRRVDGVAFANGVGLLVDIDLTVVDVFFDEFVLLSEFLRVILFFMLPKILRSMVGGCVDGGEGK
jgi:hypothetical protein